MKLLLASLFVSLLSAQTPAEETIQIDARAAAAPFPHFWEQMFGSGRAILALRQSYRDDVKAVKAVTDFRYVRFHAILHDEVGIYNEDNHGEPIYNFAYVDQIYDGLLKQGIRPVVEISFMPKKLAFNPDALHPFWYKQNVSPPKSWEKWDGLMTHFAQHLVDHYGIDEVSQWYFEVWNEPNIDFWNGVPRLESYFELYDHTARSLKAVNPHLRVGGPATAAAQWIPEFLKHASEKHIPVDFVTSHGYADDTVANMFGTSEDIPMNERVCRAIHKVRSEIKASATPALPLFWTEWNVPGRDEVRDTSFVGPALANTIRGCDGEVDMMSFWTLSDVFEEGGPIAKPFEGHFGLRAEYGINKPSYYDFALLHTLGSERLPNASHNAIVTKRADGSLVIAVWNLAELNEDAPGQKGSPRTVAIRFSNLPAGAAITMRRVDPDHSNTLAAYKALGSPLYPTEQQVEKMNSSTQLEAPQPLNLESGQVTLDLAVNSLAVLSVTNASSTFR